MAGLFGGKTKTPKVRDVPIPTRTDAEVEAAAAEQRRQIALASKSQSWLTGGLGVPKSNQTYVATKLLGGGGP